jgi:hypothetical protein
MNTGRWQRERERERERKDKQIKIKTKFKADRIYIFYHHHRQNRPSLTPYPSLENSVRSGLVYTSSEFVTITLWQSKVVSLASNPQPGGLGLCIYVPSDRVAQLYTQALGSLFVASYGSQGYGGGTLTRLHTGRFRTFRPVVGGGGGVLSP